MDVYFSERCGGVGGGGVEAWEWVVRYEGYYDDRGLCSLVRITVASEK